MLKVAVIGAGNGGQALAGYMASQGCEVRISELNLNVVNALQKKMEIHLTGRLDVYGKLAQVATDAAKIIIGADLIMVATTASAHAALARQLAPVLADNQVIILNPGRTGGALEFRETLKKCGCSKRLYIAEAQTLVYACRQKEKGEVNIIGIKDKVLLSALPSSDTQHVLDMINPFYSCFKSCPNVLFTSLENYGAVFHPSVVLFNAAAIERGNSFYFYREMTPKIAEFIERLDAERVAVGKAYGIDLISAKDWVSAAYNGIEGETLCERMRNNPAYYDIVAPNLIDCRQLTEDIPTGAVPFVALGKAAGLEMPIYSSIIGVAEALLNRDFRNTGRSLKNLGLNGLTREEILQNLY
ncbi:MAG: NAD/NADP octopine/nopaline dehydrogenase family protein [Paludibacteraceae bacterium]|nr:NAD/NADP octopine/nopaline dehydrogenase family protein [Paludibacteraceae bacterium]